MKHYYRITDSLVQAGLLTAWLGCVCINTNDSFNFYFIVAGWFLPSLIVHRLISTKKHESTYNTFLITVAIITGVFIFGLLWPVLIAFELYILLVAGPILALAYTIACFMEIFYLRKRPMSYLK